MTVGSMDDAFEIAFDKIGDFLYDSNSSKRAGYNIYRSTKDGNTYFCELGNRIEINYNNGKSKNIWVDETCGTDNDKNIQIANLKLEILKLKAKLYDIISKENH